VIVIDASAVADALLDGGDRGRWASDALRGEDLHAPQLVDYEVIAVIRKWALLGNASPAKAAQALGELGRLPMRRYPAGAFVSRIWSLRDSMTAYDASYVALAEALRCPLVTTDGRLSRSHGHQAEIRSPA
jgi:predicted nucleic acid-binding protein